MSWDRIARWKTLTAIGVLASVIGVLAPLPGALAESAVDSHVYKLAPGDRITVTVFGQPELSGDVFVDDAGDIVLPLLEPLEVKDLTIFECRKLIRDRLADGILRQPLVSVQISELRPIYVSGDVRAPGLYPFRYGSTAQSAVALAGGFGLGEPARSAALSEFLAADERVRQMTFQRKALLVRRSRLEAQRDSLDSFSPPTLPGLAKNDIASIVANERDTFQTQATILHDQLDLLRSQKPRLLKRIEAQNLEIEAAKKQLTLIKQQIERYNGLVRQGLGTQTADFQFRILESNQESNIWRLTADVSRLQMESADLDLKIEDAQGSFKKQIAAELREVRERLEELDVTLPAARELRDVKLRYAGALTTLGGTLSISVTRIRNGAPVEFPATATTRLEPGDIVEVKGLLPQALQEKNAAARQSGLPRMEALDPPTPALASR